MKYFIFFILIGVAEIFAIISLHQEVGFLNSIYIYLAGTVFGGVLIYRDWGVEVAKFKQAGSMDRDWLQSISENPQSFSEYDADKLRPLYESFIFFAAVVCICIPGIVTDILGILMAITPLRRQFAQISINRHVHNK